MASKGILKRRTVKHLEIYSKDLKGMKAIGGILMVTQIQDLVVERGGKNKKFLHQSKIQ